MPTWSSNLGNQEESAVGGPALQYNYIYRPSLARSYRTRAPASTDPGRTPLRPDRPSAPATADCRPITTACTPSAPPCRCARRAARARALEEDQEASGSLHPRQAQGLPQAGLPQRAGRKIPQHHFRRQAHAVCAIIGLVLLALLPEQDAPLTAHHTVRFIDNDRETPVTVLGQTYGRCRRRRRPPAGLGLGAETRQQRRELRGVLEQWRQAVLSM